MYIGHDPVLVLKTLRKRPQTIPIVQPHHFQQFLQQQQQPGENFIRNE